MYIRQTETRARSQTKKSRLKHLKKVITKSVIYLAGPNDFSGIILTYWVNQN